MHTVKILTLLRGLSPTLFRKLGKMVRSPFFTTNDNLVSLYKYLQPHYPAFDAPQLEKQRVFQKLFPKHSYSDIKLRNLLREMTKLVEDLLIYQKLESEDFERKKMLAEIYQEQQQIDLFEKTIKHLRAKLQGDPYRDGLFYENAFKLNLLHMEHIQSVDLKHRAALLQEALFYLEQNYQLIKIKLETEGKVLAKLWLPAKVNKPILEKPILLQIYQKIADLLKTEEMPLFFEIKQLLLGSLEIIRPAQQHDILLYLINFGISKMRLDDEYYNDLVFDLYQLGVEQGMLISNNRISDHTFLNTCIIGAKAGEFKWLDTFVKKYESMLSAASRSDIKNLSLSSILFHQGEFQAAIELLDQGHFTNPLQYISARIHTLRCYYELCIQDGTYLELLIDQTFAFEQLVRRDKKFSEEKRKSYFNFTQFLRQLAKRRSIGKLNQDTQAFFHRVLETQKITVSRSWLLKKIEQ